MKTVTYRIGILLFLAVLFAAVHGYAQQVTAPKKGALINNVNSTTPLTLTGSYFTSTSGVVLRNDNPVMDIALSFLDEKNNIFPFDWAIQVSYQVKFWQTNTGSPAATETGILTINYDRNNPYKDIDIKTYTNGYNKAELIVTSIVFTKYLGGSPVNSSSIPVNGDFLDWDDIELSIRYTPDFVFSTTSTNPTLTPSHSPSGTYFCPDNTVQGTTLPPKNEVKITWPTIVGAESYDLEWVFMDIPEGNTFAAPYYFDWRNAVRVNVVGTSTTIPLAYPRGKIVYRVRSVSRWWYANESKYYRLEGSWSRVGSYTSDPNLDKTSDLGTMPNNCYFNYCGLEPKKNWAYSASYVEEGKRVEQLSFLDATGRDRKDISFNYETPDVAIINRTYYDKQGRAAAKILPTPVTNEGNSYYKSFTDGFDNTDFDEEALWASGNAGLPSGHPTTTYYSTSNPFLSTAVAYKDVQKYGFIPTADNYGFVQINYKNDGSGRVDAMSMPGAMHKMGNGHDVKNTYGSVTGQGELDRVFGNEIGFSEHYKKNKSIDQNGVTSISYVDGSGRTVATALAGDPAIQNLNSITHSPESITLSLMDNLQIGSNGSVTTSKELVVAVPGEYVFNYSLTGQDYSIPCFENVSCLYDVHFSVTKENGQPVTLTNAVGGGTFSGTFIGVSSQSAFGFKVNFTEPGKYTVTKVTTLSSQMQNYTKQLANHIKAAGPGPNNPCIPQEIIETPCYNCKDYCDQAYTFEMSYEGVTGTVWVMPAPSAVEPTIQYSNNPALVALFPEDITYDDGTNIQIIQELITACKKSCDNPTPTVNMSECDVMRQTLLHDVSPGGQYFDNHPLTLGNPLATQADKDRWLKLFVGESLKTVLLGMAGLPSGSWEDLRGVWTGDMSLLLLPLHPEYCQYDYFCNYVGGKNESCCDDIPNVHANSNAYDMAMHNGHTNAYGFAGKFFDPLDMESEIPLAYQGLCPHKDPYFCKNKDNESIMKGYLKEYIPNPWDGGYFSIWDVLDNAAASYTANPSNPAEVAIKQFFNEMADRFTNPSNPYPMSKYQFFRGYYQGRKKQIIQNDYSTWAASNCVTCTNFTSDACYTCVNGMPSGTVCQSCWLSAYDAQPDGFVDAGHSVAGCYPDGTPLSLDNFTIRYPYIQALQDPQDITQTDLCGTQCRAYALNWINQLSDAWMGCDFSPLGTGGFTQAMKDDLYDAFYNYCMGECTPLTDIGASPDFTTPTAVADLQSIVSDFESNTGAQYCPVNFYTPTVGYGTELNDIPSDRYVLPCQCGNLAELITAAGALKEPNLYPNPLLWDRYGVTADDVVNVDDAVDWINDVLLQLDPSATLITRNDLETWLLLCKENNVKNIDSAAVAPYNRVKPLPKAFNCLSDSESDVAQETPCTSINSAVDDMQMWLNFNYALDNFVAQYAQNLNSTCLNGLAARETFTVTYTLDEFHYTLYYYDRAGNLIKTVPPAGIKTLTATERTAADAYRNSSYTSPTYASSAGFVRPDHVLVTNYKYNSMDQLIESTTPDAGKTKHWYDSKGRLVISQNAKQAAMNPVRYSYTQYDPFGRIKEVGQMQCTTAVDQGKVQTDSWLSGTFFSVANLATREQVTYTLYDQAATGTNLPVQKNLRNRVASSFYFEVAPNGSYTNYLHATHYSYDVHGNVAQSTQDFPFLNQFGLRFATTEYEYELISGNVKKVAYRKGNADQFYHRYAYDKNNSLIQVESSRDGKIWDLEAEYFYSLIGELYREETGDKKVQGTDYASTIHGWHKAVNATRMDPTVDMGRDGRHVLATDDSHNRVARDAFGYALTYYNGDYTKAGSSLASFEHANMFSSPIGNAIMGLGTTANPRGMFNGNIAATVTAMRYDAPGVNPPFELGMVYTYDQLYRLNTSRSYAVYPVGNAFSWTGITTGNNWNTDYTYDANGNIKTLKRRDHQANMMDDLTYYYDTDVNGRLKSNKLYHVKDAVTTVPHTEDFEVTSNFTATNPTASNNFRYDETGNLNYDLSEVIGNITWNAYGKVTKVDRTSGTKPDIEYYYDASGKRILKIVKPNAGSGAQTTWIYTVFTYDAGGQLMAEYEMGYQSVYKMTVKSRYIYGASKKGRTKDNFVLFSGSSTYTSMQACSSCATDSIVSPNPASTTGFSRTLGNKQYEFSNHLGNVLVTISDKHLPVDDGTYTYSSGTLTKVNATADRKLDYYLPQVLTVTDYYPGGAPMPGRTLGTTTCTTTTTATTVTVRNDKFASGTGSYVSIGSATLSNFAGAALQVTKLSSFIGTWGARTPATTLTQGVVYDLSFYLSVGTCSAGTTVSGWRVMNSVGAIITSSNSINGTNTGSFSVPSTGTYYIEFYCTSTGTGACNFILTDVLLTYTSAYTQSTSCTTSTADGYPWGHNGQYKDNEIYGTGNAYSAEYWEYDARLLRRWNTDPIEYAWQSTYVCFNNNPINYSDPLGLEGKKDRKKQKSNGESDGKAKKNKIAKKNDDNETDVIEEEKTYDFTYEYNSYKPDYKEREGLYKSTESDESGDINNIGWAPLYKWKLVEYFRQLNPLFTPGQLENYIGHTFEDAWHQSALLSGTFAQDNYRANSEKMEGERTTVPDGVSDGFIYTMSYKNLPKGKITDEIRVPDASWYEVKAKSGNIYNSTSSYQILGHLRNLSSRVPYTYRYYGTFKATAASLSLITTYDVNIATSVTAVAATMNITLYQYKAEYMMVGGKMIVRFVSYSKNGVGLGNGLITTPVILGR